MPLKKVTAGNHLPSIGDGRFLVYSKQVNELIDELVDLGLDNNNLLIDQINEATSGAGVTIDGVLVKDGGLWMSSTTATQTSSLSTTVVCSGPTGVITTVSATLAAQASTSFTLSNDYITSSSILTAWIIDYAGTYSTNGIPYVTVDNRITNGCDITICNIHGTNALNGVIKIGFAILG